MRAAPGGRERAGRAAGGAGAPRPRCRGRWALRCLSRGFPALQRSRQGSCRSVLNGCLLFGAAGARMVLPFIFLAALPSLGGSAPVSAPPLPQVRLHPTASLSAPASALSPFAFPGEPTPLPSLGQAPPAPAPLPAVAAPGSRCVCVWTRGAAHPRHPPAPAGRGGCLRFPRNTRGGRRGWPGPAQGWWGRDLPSAESNHCACGTELCRGARGLSSPPCSLCYTLTLVPSPKPSTGFFLSLFFFFFSPLLSTLLQRVKNFFC